MKKLSLALFGIVLLLMPVLVLAAPDAVGVTISNDVLRLAPEIKIVEPVSRDLLLLGGDITIDQSVAKDVLAAGGTITIKSDVAGDVRVVGGTIVIAGKVGGNVSIAGGTVTFGSASNVAGGVAIMGGAVELNGNIAGDVVANVKSLVVGGKIGGNLHYQAEEANQINPEQVGGTITYNKITPRDQGVFSHFYSFFSLVALFGSLVVGLIFITLLPRTLRAAVARTIKNPTRDWQWGLIVLLATPLLVVFLLLTLIGIPLALVLLAVYVFVLYLAKVIIGLVLGTYILGIFKGRERAAQTPLLWLMVIGVACLWVIAGVPVLGWVIQSLATIWGLGILVRLKWQVWQKIEGR